MKNLTAEKCREQFEDWMTSLPGFELADVERRYDGKYSYSETEWCWKSWQASRQALEIALPILEQQDHEKSIIAGQLEAVRDSLSLTPHQDAIISCAIDRLNVLTLRTLELSSSLIKQQERVEGGWIEWDGSRGLPPDTMPKVEIKRRDGLTRVHYLHHCNWDHGRGDFDIIAYRVIPEQPTNQNGEQ